MAILKYQTPDGEIAMEIDGPDGGSGFGRAKGYAPSGGAGAEVDGGAFDSALSRIKAVGNSLAKTFNEIVIAPESAEVELSLKFTADAGVVFAKAGTETQMSIKLTWKSNAKTS